MALKYFYDGMSQPSRSILLFLKCTKIPFEPCVTHVAKGHHLTPEFKAINPSGKVPAIQDDKFNLSESTAILRYLCESRTVDDHWYPSDLQKRTKLNEYLSWHHTNLRMGAAMYFRTTTLIPLLTGNPPRDGSKYLKIFNDSMRMMEEYYLKDTPFILSDQVSIADLMAVMEFTQLEVMGPNKPAILPSIEKWMERCQAATDPHFSEINTVVLKVKEKFAQMSSKL
ncbi:uncharacterized protein [Clytia hemisphaerica]|uniref:uncharacterized protein n=1 Tax=Clytia hemisphaerica TaxID=252671 RepID=UPI0034D50A86